MLAALGQLSPHAVTVDERDTLTELQLAALSYSESIPEGRAFESRALRFLKAGRSLESTWAALSVSV